MRRLGRFGDRELTLAEAASLCGLTSNTLRVVIHRHRLAARKRGRDWFVTPSALDAYLASRDCRGRRPRDPRALR